MELEWHRELVARLDAWLTRWHLNSRLIGGPEQNEFHEIVTIQTEAVRAALAAMTALPRQPDETGSAYVERAMRSVQALPVPYQGDNAHVWKSGLKMLETELRRASKAKHDTP